MDAVHENEGVASGSMRTDGPTVAAAASAATLGGRRWDYQKILWSFALASMVTFGGILLREHTRVSDITSKMDVRISDLTSALANRVTSIESDRFRSHEGQALREDNLKTQGDLGAISARLDETSKVQVDIVGTLREVSGTMREISIRLEAIEAKEIPPKEVKQRFDAIEHRIDKIESRYESMLNRLIMNFERYERQGFNTDDGVEPPWRDRLREDIRNDIRKYREDQEGRFTPPHYGQEPFGHGIHKIETYDTTPFIGMHHRILKNPCEPLPTVSRLHDHIR